MCADYQVRGIHTYVCLWGVSSPAVSVFRIVFFLTVCPRSLIGALYYLNGRTFLWSIRVASDFP